MIFKIGDKVVKNPATWVVNDFDNWGRGVGVGEVVDPEFIMEPTEVDVRWPAGRCFEDASSLLPFESDEPRPQSSFARLDGPPFFEDDQECLYCHRPIGEPHKPGCRQ